MGLSSKGEFTDKILLASEHQILLSVELDAAKVPVGGSYPKGQVLGIITASKKAAPYDDAASDGTEVAAGILRKEVTIENAEDADGGMIIHGAVYEADCVGLDANAKADLPLIKFI